ncbi:TRAP transporter large permease [Paraglaciecola psychrophila]|uniref:TRAP transporter large permease protein n=1 Tax=Paraglaciecola psychrophila 170 TaxID=1129794 RepID=K7A5B7_9ALTE|nr:TRAP transporter large permease subunit [Paraglaciecola psychrophila]AGH42579.1 TRAP-type mannitol/chloroaromatic compound transporter large permease [Paraglaciecola psychrophila 170]GAC36038.1 TRAP-type mannitol/chloroaromatic compound transport system, large permease component [Paraglaciecola psychrophila 170]
MEYLSLLMFLAVCLVLLLGYPVAYSLAGTALIFAGIGAFLGVFDTSYLQAVPSRLFGIVSNQTLIAVPLFVFMGIMLEKSRVAEDLLLAMEQVLGRLKSGLAISVVLVGMLLAASTGIVGATVVTMGLLSLPTMLKKGYSPSFACGAICATGTLGQIIPPSIALVLLGDVLSSAFQQAQLNMGIFSPRSVSVGDLFVGALVPGFLLVAMYLLYVLVFASRQIDPSLEQSDQAPISAGALFAALFPPLLLIFMVLGSILGGFATPTEAAGVGAAGALVLALINKKLNLQKLKDVMMSTTKVTSMVFLILIGASIFSLVFRGFGGEELIEELFASLPGGVFSAVLLVMVVIFLLGFILDFIEITFVVVPLVAPVLLAMGVDPIWLGIMIAVNLQTSFLTPPFGFALFYLRGVAPPEVKTSDIYRGVAPFIFIQLLLLACLAIWPNLVTWLPSLL